MPPSSIAVRRRSSWRASFGWTVNSSGVARRASFSSVSLSAATAVIASAPVERGIAPSCSSFSASSKDAFSRSCAARSICLDLRDKAGCLVRRQHALVDQLLLVELPHGRMRVDLLDHQRLRVRRLVLLVVTEPPVADEVDHDVLAEAAPVRHRQPGGGDRRLGIVGVDVDDRDVEALREIGRVPRRAALVRIGREADLVVRDQVQRAAGRIARRGRAG